jgi:hypothetical protein
MRFAAVMLFDERRAEVGELSSGLLADYCQRHGYLLRLHRDLLEPSRPAPWNKLVAVREALDEADWVFWFDADVLIADFERPLTELLQPGASMVVSRDFAGPCTGLFGLESCEWSAELLHTWWFLGEPSEPYGRGFFEQDTFWAMLDLFPAVASRVAAIPEEVVANPRTPRVDRPFAYHDWTSNSPQNEIVDRYEQRFGRGRAP